MKHRLYEGWIIARGEISPDQERELHLHLEKCEACQAFAQAEQAVDRTFSSVQMMQPVPGFTKRWKARLNEKRETAHRRQTSFLMGLLSFGTIILIMPLALQMLLVVISPEELLFDYAKGAVEWLAWFEFLGEIIVTFINVLISTIPIGWWLSIAVVLSGVCIVWGLSIRQLGFLKSRKGV